MASLGSSQPRGRLAGHLLLGSVLFTTVWVAPAFGHPGVHSAWSGPVAPLAVSPDSAVSGEWSAPFSEGGLFDAKPPQTVAESKLKPTAVSAAVLPDGRILYWGGLEGLEDGNFPALLEFGRTLKKSRSRILDLSGPNPEWSIPAPEDGGSDDMFCADQRLLYDGRVIVVGGSIAANDPVDLTGVPGGPAGTSELYGSKATRLFSPSANSWSLSQNMKFARWYPTLLTLPDGRQFVASGVERLIYNTKGLNVHETEIYDPTKGTWFSTGVSGNMTMPLFARLHLTPDGKVFYGGSGQMWSPAGQALDEAMWITHKLYDPVKNLWTTLGAGVLGARSGVVSVLLPLKPPYSEAKILVAGGTLGTSPGSYVANNFSEIITVKDGTSSSVRGPDLNHRRWFSSGVLLPDGGVIVASGGDKDEVLNPGSEAPVRQAELYDGTKWISLASAKRDRTYHNSAILLADGTVLVGGHSPINAGGGAKGDPANDDSGLFANNLKDPSFEIFRPPYLFRGDRPTITGVQRGIAWEEAVPTGFRITTPDASKIQKVVLVRLPSTTHVTDADMRAVELSFTRESSSVLHATSPPNGKVAPPGWYYLFLLQDNGGGLTPSCARIVRVGAAIDASAAPALCRVGSFLGSSQPGLAATGRGPLASPLLGIVLLAAAALIMRMLAAPKRAY